MDNKLIKGCEPSGGDKQLIYDNLDEWLNDEGKIITYRWLSLTLGLHINHAKETLEDFVNLQRSQGVTLSVTYCLSGLITHNDVQVHKVTIVKEDMRASVESAMLPPTSCHIYSIQKSPLKNSDVLYTADFDIRKSSGYDVSKHSAVQCHGAKLRGERAKNDGVLSFAPHTSVSVNKSSATPSPVSSSSDVLKNTANGDTSKQAGNAGKQPDKVAIKANTGFSKLFAGAVGKQKVESPIKNVPTNQQVTSKPSTNVTSDFSEKRTMSDSSKSAISKSTPVDSKITKVVSKSASSSRQAMKVKPEPEKKVTKTELGLAATKRRRIIVESSSEDEEEIAISPTPSPEPVEIPVDKESMEQSEPMDVASDVTTVVNSTSSKPTVQRKLVSKTFVNDEGFMVTEKVWENETGSDDNKQSSVAEAASSSSVPVKPVPTSAPLTLVASNSGPHKKKGPEKKAPAKSASGKQASLMNFFQKK